MLDLPYGKFRDKGQPIDNVSNYDSTQEEIAVSYTHLDVYKRQISDTGISPGSGVGNHRGGLTRETVGVPVIAIGIPTVVDAATIVNDTMENLIAALETSEALRGVGVVLQGYTAAEKYDLVRELISPHLNGLFVTPKDIDDTIRRISYTLSEALNLLLSGKAKEA